MKPAARLRDVETLRAVIAASDTVTGVVRAFGLEPSWKRMRIVRRLAAENGIDVSHLVAPALRRAATGYGRYTREQLTQAAAASTSACGVMRLLGMPSRRATCTVLRKRLVALGIDISHFKGSGWMGGVPSNLRKPWPEVLIRVPPDGPANRTEVLRRAMVESGIEERCASCGQGRVWYGRPLVLQIDHVDGDTRNNLSENLRFLCPNCHSQTETYGAKNRRRKATEAIPAGSGTCLENRRG